jgi:hypothetical protein
MGLVTKVFDPFDVEELIFQNNMRVDVVKMIKPFLHFLNVYDSHYVQICSPLCVILLSSLCELWKIMSVVRIVFSYF